MDISGIAAIFLKYSNNALKEELAEFSTVAKFATTAAGGIAPMMTGTIGVFQFLEQPQLLK